MFTVRFRLVLNRAVSVSIHLTWPVPKQNKGKGAWMYVGTGSCSTPNIQRSLSVINWTLTVPLLCDFGERCQQDADKKRDGDKGKAGDCGLKIRKEIREQIRKWSEDYTVGLT